jgi:hypothetical protein
LSVVTLIAGLACSDMSFIGKWFCSHVGIGDMFHLSHCLLSSKMPLPGTCTKRRDIPTYITATVH